jgi:DNA polymerase-3 subunit beta
MKMKFSIDKNIILENLSNVIKGVSTKNVIPVLNGIKFELRSEGLYLTASDSELVIQSFIERKLIKNVDNEGVIIIGSKYILEILRKMPSDVINFEVIDSLKIKIYSDFNQYNLNCLDPSEYPNLRLEEHKDPIVLQGELFKSIINQTSFAISTQELRPLLTGVNIKITGDLLECIATDSYRLAKKNIKLENPIVTDVNIVIPGKNVIELEKIIVDNENIEMHIFNNKVLFKYKNIIFQTNLLSGTYPNTSNLIPTEFEIIVQTKKDEFSSAVDRAALLTQGKDKNIIKMRIENKEMIINSYASEIGKTEERLMVETSENSNIDISFSAKYMLDALKTLKDEDILILLNNDVKPIVMKSLKDESLIQLILPIKTY